MCVRARRNGRDSLCGEAWTTESGMPLGRSQHLSHGPAIFMVSWPTHTAGRHRAKLADEGEKLVIRIGVGKLNVGRFLADVLSSYGVLSSYIDDLPDRFILPNKVKGTSIGLIKRP
jgi:hypothetical protein